MRGRCITSLYQCQRKYSGRHNQCDNRVVDDGTVGCLYIDYTTVFLYSDWLNGMVQMEGFGHERVDGFVICRIRLVSKQVSKLVSK